MQFQILAILSFVAFAFAAPVGTYDLHVHLNFILMDGLIPQTHSGSIHDLPTPSINREARLTLLPAQSTQAQPSGEAAAMSDASGNVVSFDSANVYLGKLTHVQHTQSSC
jgi:hypothetical protein